MIGSGLNRKYKDTLFTMYFGKEYKENALSLYNALNHSSYANTDDLQITTIDSVVMLGYKNDLSFIVDGVLSIIEQQSTLNPNMPLRGLFYFSLLYNQYIEKQGGLYSKKLIMLPTPQYTVLYNGVRKDKEKYTMRLSDAYLRKDIQPDLECTATVYNINSGNNPNFLENCRPLNDYATFVDLMRKNQEIYPTVEEAARATIRECIEKGIMADFLKSHHEEIISMCIEEFDAEKYAQTLFDEGRIEGRIEGRKEGRIEGHKEGQKEGLTNMLKGMLVSFKHRQLPLEDAYQFISFNPECQSMSFEEIEDIWNSLP